MGRPTENRKGNRITVRLSDDMMEKISDRNISEAIREMFESDAKYEPLREMAFLYDTSEETLMEIMRYLLDSEHIYFVDGKIKWSQMYKNPDYPSVDDRIDVMNLSEGQKIQLKRNIIQNLDSASTQDDTGNGAGV